MNKYTEANKRLALALGWTEIVEVGGALLGTPPDGAPKSRGQAMVPDWCGDWRECGPLMAAHSMDIFHGWGSVAAVPDNEKNKSRVAVDCDDDRDLATRYAIVQVAASELDCAK